MADVDGPFWAGESRRAQVVAGVAAEAAERAAYAEDGGAHGHEELVEGHVDAVRDALHDVLGPFGEGKSRRAQEAESAPEAHAERGGDRAELVPGALDDATDVRECPAGRRGGTAA